MNLRWVEAGPLVFHLPPAWVLYDGDRAVGALAPHAYQQRYACELKVNSLTVFDDREGGTLEEVKADMEDLYRKLKEIRP